MSDLIDRQIAISAICNACGKIDCDQVDKCEKLQLLPANNSEIPNSSDTISRQEALDALNNIEIPRNASWYPYYQQAITAVDKLPPAQPAQPERIKGHWIESKGQNILLKNLIEKGETWRVCDRCGAGFMIGYQYECDKAYHETFHNFCPKCGAEMEVTT